MSSLFVAQEFDLKFDDAHYENHAAYLQSWIAVLKDNPDEMYKAAEQAEKAVVRKLTPKEKLLADLKEDKAVAMAITTPRG